MAVTYLLIHIYRFPNFWEKGASSVYSIGTDSNLTTSKYQDSEDFIENQLSLDEKFMSEQRINTSKDRV